MRSYAWYVEQFINGVKKTEKVDYSDANSVKLNNKGVNQYRQAAINIKRLFPDRIGDFAEMLYDKDRTIALCCAICIVEIMQCNGSLKNKAIQVVDTYINIYADETDKMGLQTWMNNYKMN